MSQDDAALLREYAESHSQAAFAELVRRHVNLVFSAARRQVPSHHVAEDVTQAVFVTLAQNPRSPKAGTPLAAWLYLVTRRTAIDLLRREARRQAREQAATEIATMKTTTPVWHRIETVLDEAMASLNATDSSALLLRFFENKSLREVGETLGVSEDAAQKRISRALEHLRGDFARRGIAVTVAGLATDLSAHAVTVAPVALTGTIAAAGAGAAAQAANAASTTFAMTTFQKTIVAAGLAVALGGVLFEAHAVRSQGIELAALHGENEALVAQIAATRQKNMEWAQEQELRQRAVVPVNAEHAALEAQITMWLTTVARAKELFARHPEQAIPEMKLMMEQEWFDATQGNDLDDPVRREVVMRALRGFGKAYFSVELSIALQNYVRANGGQLPGDALALLPYFKDNARFKAAQVEPAMLQRYAVVHSGAVADLSAEERNSVLVEITSYEEEKDTRILMGPGSTSLRNFRDWESDVTRALRTYAKANAGERPSDPAQLIAYFNPPLSAGRQGKFLADPGILARYPAAPAAKGK